MVVAVGLASAAEVRFPTLPLGSPMPSFELPGVDGKLYKSADWSSTKVLMVVFTCNHCPTAQLYEDRIKAIVNDYRDQSLQVVAIQPNNPNSIRMDELGYTDVSDSFPEMKIRAEYRHFNFPYLYDGDTQEVARAFGPASTPHVFLFDESRILRYEGRIDDSPRESMVKRRDAREAIDAILNGRPVRVSHTPSIGCSTKWLYKETTRDSEIQHLLEEPVAVKEVGAEELTNLAHKSTGKITLVNFWATWCGPCIVELPQFTGIWQMYRRRAFEMVTVSVNYPDEKKGVLANLERAHASMRNLMFGSSDTYALMKAFDPEWNSSVPYTVLLGINGEVLWKYQGEPDMRMLRRRILANLPDDDYVGQQAYWRSGGK